MAESLQLKRVAVRAALADQRAKPRQRVSTNALVGMGLWLLLWLGYNTDLGRLSDPRFPANILELIHGVRAFFPMVAAWIACLMICARVSRLFSWIMGPLGLILLYAVTGLVSSLTLSPNPQEAWYYAVNYLAIVLVLLATVLVEDPLSDLRKMLSFTWGVGAVLTFSLLGAIPFLGSQAISTAEPGPVGTVAYDQVFEVAGMAGSRNTGFARYAAITALVALPGLLKKGTRPARVIWGIMFLLSMYALIIANGRTETMAFLASVGALFWVRKARRFTYFLLASGAAILLGLRNFYSTFYLYITRTGKLDVTMTGRTMVWDQGWRYVWKSPWAGFGFQADRYFLNFHLHNAFLHVLLQAGWLGGGAIFLGLAIVWYYIIHYFFVAQPSDKSLIPPEIPAVFLFVTLSSVLESTFAYFSAAWLLSAPIVAYVVALHQHMRRSQARAAQEVRLRAWLTKRNRQAADYPTGVGVAPPPAAGGAGH